MTRARRFAWFGAWSFAALAFFTDVSSAQPAELRLWGPATPPAADALAVEQVRNVRYVQGPRADLLRQRLDLYLPKGRKQFPVLVLVHGGAWVIGDNRCFGLYTSVGEFLASRGIGVVLPNYRLSPWVKHPAHVEDVARAVAWTRANIGKYGGDPERLFLAGHSAGGHLVSLLATDETWLKAEGMTASALRGVITISGVYHIPEGDVKATLGGNGGQAFHPEQIAPLRAGEDKADGSKFAFAAVPVSVDVYSAAFGRDAKVRAAASPVTHVRPGLPPFLILTAQNDLPTLGAMAEEFHHALKEKDCRAELLRVENRNHNSIMFSAIRVDDPVARAVVEFVRKHGR
jgi:acetyl esterase/lipase